MSKPSKGFIVLPKAQRDLLSRIFQGHSQQAASAELDTIKFMDELMERITARLTRCNLDLDNVATVATITAVMTTLLYEAEVITKEITEGRQPVPLNGDQRLELADVIDGTMKSMAVMTLVTAEAARKVGLI